MFIGLNKSRFAIMIFRHKHQSLRFYGHNFLGSRFIRIIIRLCDVNCIGISGLTRAQIQSAQAEKHRWKLIETLENVNGQMQGSVKPVSWIGLYETLRDQAVSYMPTPDPPPADSGGLPEYAATASHTGPSRWSESQVPTRSAYSSTAFPSPRGGVACKVSVICFAGYRSWRLTENLGRAMRSA